MPPMATIVWLVFFSMVVSSAASSAPTTCPRAQQASTLNFPLAAFASIQSLHCERCLSISQRGRNGSFCDRFQRTRQSKSEFEMMASSPVISSFDSISIHLCNQQTSFIPSGHLLLRRNPRHNYHHGRSTQTNFIGQVLQNAHMPLCRSLSRSPCVSKSRLVYATNLQMTTGEYENESSNESFLKDENDQNFAAMRISTKKEQLLQKRFEEAMKRREARLRGGSGNAIDDSTGKIESNTESDIAVDKRIDEQKDNYTDLEEENESHAGSKTSDGTGTQNDALLSASAEQIKIEDESDGQKQKLESNELEKTNEDNSQVGRKSFAADEASLDEAAVAFTDVHAEAEEGDKVENIENQSNLNPPSVEAERRTMSEKSNRELSQQTQTESFSKRRANSGYVNPRKYKTGYEAGYKDTNSWDDPYEDFDYEDDRYPDDYNSNEDGDSYYNMNRSPTSPSLEWETYRSSSVLFPPPSSYEQSKHSRSSKLPFQRPKAIIHFIGGTFFGSYPRKFYGSLLERIAIQCDAVVVATPIPLVLPGIGLGKGLVNTLERWVNEDSYYDDDYYGSQQRRRNDARSNDKNEDINSNNPLDHLALAESIQKEFNTVYRDIILDEYCYDLPPHQIEQFMKQVPIVGMGHSLGARLQAVSCAHPRIAKRVLAMGKGRRLVRSGREGMIYLGFANWGAGSSIPGVESLERRARRKSRKRDDVVRTRRDGGVQRKERYYDDKEGVGRRESVWRDDDNDGNDEFDERSSRRRSEERFNGRDRERRRPNYDLYDRPDRNDRYSNYYGNEDLELSDIFSDVFSSVASSAKQIGEALTPDAKDLEFRPTPDELWDDLARAEGSYGGSCRKTLIVQFDDDPIDQGSRLARTLLSAYKEEAKKEEESEKVESSTLGEEENVLNEPAQQPQTSEPPLMHDVKFARLSGGHLTPVTIKEGIGKLLPKGALSLLSSSSDFIVRQLGDLREIQPTRRQERQVQDVADTVASYIREVIFEDNESKSYS